MEAATHDLLKGQLSHIIFSLFRDNDVLYQGSAFRFVEVLTPISRLSFDT